MSTIVYYVRHGQTAWNAQRRFQGRRDISLNEQGVAQARRNGRALAEVLHDPGDFRFICSPLSRARKTMEVMREEMGLAPDGYEILNDLIEASYGDFEGWTVADIERDRPGDFNARKADPWHFQPTGGESMAMVQARIAQLIAGLPERCVIVGHGAVGRAFRRQMLRLSEAQASDFAFPQDKVFRFEGGREELI